MALNISKLSLNALSPQESFSVLYFLKKFFQGKNGNSGFIKTLSENIHIALPAHTYPFNSDCVLSTTHGCHVA